MAVVQIAVVAVITVVAGEEVLPAGSPCGQGLSKQAADDLDLCPGTPVGTSLIDAHAGALGRCTYSYPILNVEKKETNQA